MSVPGTQFVTTRWSLVLAAGDDSAATSHAALEDLCQSYWHPLYAYARRRGHSAQDAADLTQEFFARLIEKDFLESADPERGRFRTFLLTLFQRFMIKAFNHENAIRRGGAHQRLSFDFAEAEGHCDRLSDQETPESTFEREWAMTLLGRAMSRLASEYAGRGKAELYAVCQPFLNAHRIDLASATAADALGMSEGAVRVAIHRMKERFRELLRLEIAETVGPDESVDDELRQLRLALGS